MKNGLAFIIQFMKRAAKQNLFHWKKHYEKLPWIKNFFSGLRTHNVMVPSPLKITSAKRTNSKYWRILLQKHPTLELLFHQRQDKTFNSTEWRYFLKRESDGEKSKYF